MARAAVSAFALLLACTLPAASQQRTTGSAETAADAEGGPPPEALRWLSRSSLENARALRREGRLDAAERVVRRGLRHAGDDPALLRELSHVLSEQGRTQEADEARARADRIAPPPAPLPQGATPTARGRSLVVLVQTTAGRRLDEPGRWPEQPVLQALTARLAERLPGTPMQRADPESVAGGARWLGDQDVVRALSLRVDRADCRFSVKDGAIAVVELRIAAAARGAAAGPAQHVKAVVEDPAPDACLDEAVGRALELALEGDAFREIAAHAEDAAAPDWSTTSLRPLFPGLDRRIARELRHGRALLRAGRLGDAAEAFEEAARIDPRDPDVRAFLDDAARSLVLARQIAAGDPAERDPAVLDPRLSPAQRAAAQVALEREQARRDELLAALAVLDEDVQAPAAKALTALRPVEIREPEAFGPTLARRRTDGGRVVARAAYAPDGSVLARYYFAAEDAGEPLVREEDTSGDGAADRWISYRAAARSELYEDGRGGGRPDRRLVFTADGERVERIELDLSGDERPDRVFHYRAGALLAEERDTNGDGRLDRFDRFDAEGRVGMREEDLDGDGSIDVRSEYQGGKLVRRELADPEYAPES